MGPGRGRGRRPAGAWAWRGSACAARAGAVSAGAAAKAWRARAALDHARGHTHTLTHPSLSARPWRRIRMPRRAPRRGACVCPKSPARRQAGHRGLGDNAGAASPALASDGSLLHRRWHTARFLVKRRCIQIQVDKQKQGSLSNFRVQCQHLELSRAPDDGG